MGDNRRRGGHAAADQILFCGNESSRRGGHAVADHILFGGNESTDKSGGRILLGDNTGCVAVMLRPIRC